MPAEEPQDTEVEFNDEEVEGEEKEAAEAEMVADALLTETSLRGVRKADQQDGHPTTIQTDFSEEDPRTTWRRPAGRWARR